MIDGLSVDLSVFPMLSDFDRVIQKAVMAGGKILELLCGAALKDFKGKGSPAQGGCRGHDGFDSQIENKEVTRGVT